MYLDYVTDGMLKGLGQMMSSMMYNIMDAGLSVLMVLLLLPRFQVPGYIFIIFFVECFNFALSIRRLFKVAKPKFL
jgi:Na+-driven multidrug efflux pump